MPWKLVVIDPGSVSLAIFSTAAVAWLSATSLPRLKEIVAEGSWPRCATRSGPTVVFAVATAVRGTSVPLAERTYRDERDEASRWSCGFTSRMTSYSFVAV